ncbi:MAG TPA: hypothetical protein VLI54_04800 [Bacillota bacterium]|nr:hypothetical protein [Bacillota bacterium]
MAHPDAKPGFAAHQDRLQRRLLEQIAAFGSGGVWKESAEPEPGVSREVAAAQYEQLRALVAVHGETAVGAAFGTVVTGMAEAVIAAAAHADVAPYAAEPTMPLANNGGPQGVA